jgi:uncharacterized protein YcbX
VIQFDRAATREPVEIDVDVDGSSYTIPALPASDWLVVIAHGTWADIVPGLLPRDATSVLEDRLADLQVGHDAIRQAAQAALAAAAGTKWWTARLLAVTTVTTHLAARLRLAGVDPTVVSLGAYLSTAYTAAQEGMDRQARAQFDMELQRPPAGVAPEEWYDEDAAADGFLAAMGSMAAQA